MMSHRRSSRSVISDFQLKLFHTLVLFHGGLEARFPAVWTLSYWDKHAAAGEPEELVDLQPGVTLTAMLTWNPGQSTRCMLCRPYAME